MGVVAPPSTGLGGWSTALTFRSIACRTRLELRSCIFLHSRRLVVAVLAAVSSSSLPCRIAAMDGVELWLFSSVVAAVCVVWCCLLLDFSSFFQVSSTVLLCTAVHLIAAPPPFDIQANLMTSKVQSAPNGPNSFLSRISFFMYVEC